MVVETVVGIMMSEALIMILVILIVMLLLVILKGQVTVMMMIVPVFRDNNISEDNISCLCMMILVT